MARAFQLVQIFPTADGGGDDRRRRGLAAGQALAAVLAAVRRRARSTRRVREVAEIFGLERRLDTAAAAAVAGREEAARRRLRLRARPEVILLDEPTSGVSTADKHGIMKTLIAAAKRAGVKGHHAGRARHGPGGRLFAPHHRAVGGPGAGRPAARQFFADPTSIETVVGKRRGALNAERCATSPSTSRAAAILRGVSLDVRQASWSAWSAATAPARPRPSARIMGFRKPVSGTIAFEGAVARRPAAVSRSRGWASALRRRRARCSAN